MVISPVHSPLKRKRLPFMNIRVMLPVIMCAGVLINLRYNGFSSESKTFAIRDPERNKSGEKRDYFKTEGSRILQPSEYAPAAVIPSPLPATGIINTTTLTSFVESGGRFPILLLTRKRVSELNATISSLLSVRGVEREAVYVIQDGNSTAVREVIESYGLRFHQKVKRPSIPSNVRTITNIRGFRIASHFRYSLDYMFDTVTEVRGDCVTQNNF